MWRNRYYELRSGWAILLAGVMFLLVNIALGTVVGIFLVISLFQNKSVPIDKPELFANEITRMITGTGLLSIWIGMSVNVMLILVLIMIFKRFYRRPLREMGLSSKKSVPRFVQGCIFGAVSISAATVILILTGQAEFVSGNLSDAFSFVFMLDGIHFVFVALAEETLCRGYMMTVMKTTRVKWLIVALPAVLFGLLHISNPNAEAFGLVNIMLVGLLMAVLFIKTGSIWAPVGYHFTWNFIQGNVFGVPVSGTQRFSIMTYAANGPDWLTGGAFGVEGGAMCSAVIVLGLLFVFFFMKTQPNADWTLTSGLPLAPFISEPTGD